MRTNRLSAAFSALADPTRRAIVRRLARGETSVGELAAPFRMSLPAVSRHLKVLAEARLVQRRREAQRRICRLRPAPLKDVAEWVEQYRRFWEGRLDALADYLEAVKNEEESKHGGKKRIEGRKGRKA